MHTSICLSKFHTHNFKGTIERSNFESLDRTMIDQVSIKPNISPSKQNPQIPHYHKNQNHHVPTSKNN